MTRLGVRRRVALVALSALAVGGVACGSDDAAPPEDTSTSTSSAGSVSTSSTTPPVQGTTITLTIVGGQVEGGVSRHDIKLGDTVTIRVESDTEEELHVHGYDETADLVPGSATELTFVADIPGVFEVELEDSGRKVAELQVA